MNGNHLTIEGNLTRSRNDAGELQDALVLRTGPNGTKYVRFSIARSYMRGDTTIAEFFNCVVFGDQAVNLAASASKGNRVLVEGHLSQSKWETPDGAKRSNVEIIADAVAPVLRWAQVAIERTPRIDAAVEVSDPDLIAFAEKVTGEPELAAVGLDF